MAGHATYTALLDACVFYPIITADALISLACEGLYAPKWTELIEEEWVRNLLTNRPELEGRLSRRAAIRDAVPDWEVPTAAWTPIAAGLQLPDMKDVHVLAAAIAGHCDCIVTANLRDFPKETLAAHNVEAIHPDDFLIAQLDLNPIAALTALKEMRGRRKNPPYSAEEFAERFAANGLVRTAEKLREARNLI